MCNILDVASGSFYEAKDYLERIDIINPKASAKLSEPTLKFKSLPEQSNIVENINISDTTNPYKFLDIGNFAPSVKQMEKSFEQMMDYFDIFKTSNMAYAISTLKNDNLDLFNLVKKNPEGGIPLQRYYEHLEKTLRLISLNGVNHEARQFLLTGLFVAAINNEKNGLDKIKKGLDKNKDNPMSFYLSLINSASKDKKLHNLTLEAMANAYRFIKHTQNPNVGWDTKFSNSLVKFKINNDNEAATNKKIKTILEGIYGKTFTEQELEKKIKVIKALIEIKDNNKPSECE